MTEEQTIESILVADCGAVNTNLLLLERVAESYRFVAQAETLTTAGAPWNDVSVGVVHAIRDLERITGRKFHANGKVIVPREGLTGVDAFVVILSAPEPLHVVLAGLVPEMSLESASHAVASIYASVEAVLCREGGLRSPEETWARTVRDLAPDVVLLVGGVDGGASRPVMELADAIALGASMLESDRRPRLIYAGNAKLRSQVTKLLGEIVTVDVVDNVRPTVDTEHLGPTQALLEQLYIEQRLYKLPGVDTLSVWSRLPLLPTATAFGRVVEYLWHREGRQERGVLGVDVGAASITIAACQHGELALSVHSQKGSVYGALALAEDEGVAALQQWLPEEMNAAQILAVLYNRALKPWTIPQQLPELWVEQAAVREMLRRAMREARTIWGGSQEDALPGFDPILVSGGSLVHMPRPGQILLALLDGLEPTGISTVLLDTNRAAPALGAIAGIKPLAAASALDAGTLVPLGTVISPVGKAHPGEGILQMRIIYEDGSTLDVEAHYGELELWPLLPGQRATLELRPNRRFDIGLGAPGHGGKVQVMGGLLGLVVDGRGRPLVLPENPEQRRHRLQRWLWDVGG